MKTSTLTLLTAFISAALVSLVGAQESRTAPNEDQSVEKPSEHADKSDRAGKGKDHAPPATQTEFLNTAASKGLGEVKCAQIALARSGDAKVRELAAMLVKDHSAANLELKGIAEKLGITVPSELNEKTRKKLGELEKKTGKDFDTSFLNGMAVSHRKGITLFEEGAKVSKAEPVLTFIEKTLPTLRHHANKIKELGGVDTDLTKVEENQAEAPPAPKIPDTRIPSPR